MEELLSYLLKKRIVCPLPIYWSKLYKIIKRKIPEHVDLPFPLILGGWGANNFSKNKVFKLHIAIATEFGCLKDVKQYLLKLEDDKFLHSITMDLDPNEPDCCGLAESDEESDEDAFAHRVEDNDVEGMRSLFERGGVDLERNCAMCTDGNTLVLAVENGAIDAVSYLLSIGIRLDPASITAAAMFGNDEILDLLLNAGMVPDAEALSWAVVDSNPRLKITQRLLGAGAPINGLSRYGKSALHEATIQDHTEIVEALLQAGANPNVVTSDGSTPLMYAVRGGDIAIVELLLKHGATVQIKNKDGQTAIDLARERDQPKSVVSILESYAKQ